MSRLSTLVLVGSCLALTMAPAAPGARPPVKGPRTLPARQSLRTARYGDPQAELTRQAKAAAERLAKRAACQETWSGGGPAQK